MDTLILKGKTLKGKNRVREWGSEWYRVCTSRSVACLGNQRGHLIESVKTNDKGECDARWVLAVNDPDFEISFKE